MKSVQHRIFLGSLGLVSLLVATGIPLTGCNKATGPVLVAKDTMEVKLSYPVGGEVLHQGSVVNIQWSMPARDSLNPILAVDLLLSLDDGANYDYYITGSSIHSTDAGWLKPYAWIIPNSDSLDVLGTKYLLKNNSHCRIRIQDYANYSDSKRHAESGSFTISP